ncbi:MAG: RagB/SusD family nutrient uptake outer membrane protein [Mangrovibacterium sp.]
MKNTIKREQRPNWFKALPSASILRAAKNIKELSRFIVVTALSLFIFSCSDDFLDLTPKDRIADENVWNDPSVADLFLNDIYGYLPPYRTTGWWSESWTDNCINVQTWQSQAETVRAGAMSPSNPLWAIARYDAVNDWMWDLNFAYIRKCNVFIQKVRQSDALNSEYKSERIAEAKFLRAWYYMTVFKYFGAAPIIEEPLDISTQGDQVFRERASVQETAAFISKDCLEAADSLPVVQADWGRVTKGAALALKGYIELLAASPLSNPDNDKTLWEKAAASYKQVIDLGIYQLTDYYHGLFLEENNKNAEMIFPYVIRYPFSNENPDTRFLEDLFGTCLCYHRTLWRCELFHCRIRTHPGSGGRLPDERRKKPLPSLLCTTPTIHTQIVNPDFMNLFFMMAHHFETVFIYTRKGDPYNAVDRSRLAWVTPTGYYLFKVYDERLNGLLERPQRKEEPRRLPVNPVC